MPAAEGALASVQEEERTEFKRFSRDIRALICVGGLTCRAAVPDGGPVPVGKTSPCLHPGVLEG